MVDMKVMKFRTTIVSKHNYTQENVYSAVYVCSSNYPASLAKTLDSVCSSVKGHLSLKIRSIVPAYIVIAISCACLTALASQSIVLINF